jgi:uncharacterized membrane protein YphA (DoxX/SURF4 family)
MKNAHILAGAEWFLRLALAAGFLSAVADRFGLWGPPGTPGVAWGAWPPFVQYVGRLNWFAPAAFVSVLAWTATLAETALGIALLSGWQLEWVALASGGLLLSFALAMTFALGIKAPLDFSVFSAAAGAFFLWAVSHAGNPPTSAMH